MSTIYIRPQRYTLEFVEREDCYSLCFFDESYRPALNFCGSKSGRDYDKDKETGLTPCFDQAAPYYQQARLVFFCRKLYRQDMAEDSFLDKEVLAKNYPQNDLHRMFIGEIVKVLERVVTPQPAPSPPRLCRDGSSRCGRSRHRRAVAERAPAKAQKPACTPNTTTERTLCYDHCFRSGLSFQGQALFSG